MFELNEKNQVMPTAEALLVPEFHAIWIADKERHKEQAMEEFKYLWFVASFKSPYKKNTSKEEIGQRVADEILLKPKYKPHKRVLDAIKAFEKQQYTKSLQLYDMADNVIDKAIEYYKSISVEDLAENFEKIVKTTQNIPTIVKQLEAARAAVEKDMTTDAKATKSGKQIGDREDPKPKKWD